MDVVTRLAMIAALLVAGCYGPEVRDCTVSCASASDCATGQTCGEDGWCAAPDVAGSCAARTDAPDARPVDAAIDGAASDAGVAQLHVIVAGRGKVVVDPLGVECIGYAGVPGDCLFDVSPGATEMLLPVETTPSSAFAGWTTDNCAEAASSCTVTMEPPVTLVGARFN